jgi:hypothetical protein
MTIPQPTLARVAGACLVLILTSTANAVEEPRPGDLSLNREYACKRAIDPIKIDGKLNERSWRAAASTGWFSVYPELANNPRRTQAKMLWDDKRLYIAVECTEPDIRAQRKTRDDDIYQEDAVEFFVMEQYLKDRYKHFLEYQINAYGTMTDAYNVGVYDGIVSWNSPGWKCAVKRQGSVNNSKDRDTGWTVEMSIPFFDLYAVLMRTEEQTKISLKNSFSGATPQPGDRWRANIYRLKYLEKGTEYAAWSPNMPARGFHDLEHFGTIVFSADLVGS